MNFFLLEGPEINPQSSQHTRTGGGGFRGDDAFPVRARAAGRSTAPPARTMAKTRRKKVRTHVEATGADKSGATKTATPRSFVFRRGKLSELVKARSDSHWSPYDRVGVVNADP